MTVTLVAAIARNGVIGADGGIPWHLPDDQRRFKELVTRSAGWGAGDDGVLVAPSVAEALALAATVDEEVFVVGGTRVYEEALPFADRLELTWVDAEPEGDAWFPAVDWAAWREVAREEHEGWSAVSYARAG